MAGIRPKLTKTSQNAVCVPSIKVDGNGPALGSDDLGNGWNSRVGASSAASTRSRPNGRPMVGRSTHEHLSHSMVRLRAGSSQWGGREVGNVDQKPEGDLGKCRQAITTADISSASSSGHALRTHGILRDGAFENGAGGSRTPVPRRAERRIYACSSPLISFPTRRVNNPSREQGIRISRSSEACQPFGPSPIVYGNPPHRASGGFPSRRSGRERVLRVGR